LSASDTQLNRVRELITAEDVLQKQLETQEAITADIKEQLNRVRMNDLPQAMMAAGVEKQRTPDGLDARLVYECAGTLAADPEERDRQLELLIGAGAGEVVKSIVSVAFGKDEYPKAMSLIGELTKRGLTATYARNIHPMTLKSWVKERMEAGDHLPLADVGLWYGQIAKVKRPKT
jgi:hypothetical protein